jgi:hypothetical protein
MQSGSIKAYMEKKRALRRKKGSQEAAGLSAPVQTVSRDEPNKNKKK